MNTRSNWLILTLFLVVSYINLVKCQEGTFGYIFHVKYERERKECTGTNGSFEKEYFFVISATHGTQSKSFSSDSDNYIPSWSYHLSYDSSQNDNLIHRIKTSLELTSDSCSPGSDDYQSCQLQGEGYVRAGGPNCYQTNLITIRRIHYRYCPAGFFFKGLLNQMCEQCPPNHFSEEYNKDLSCKFCPKLTDGKTCTSDCPAGYIYDVDRNQCVSCPPGTYAPHKGTLKCLKCPVGSHAPNSKSVSCTPCSGKQYQDEEGAATCKTCAHQTDQVSCQLCPAGQFFDESSRQCTYCRQGYYSPNQSDRPSCIQCATPFDYTDSTGSTVCKTCPHESDGVHCESCQPGFEFNVQQKMCTKCRIGTAKSDNSPQPCKKCHGYEYADEEGLTYCKKCQWETKDGRICLPSCPTTGEQLPQQGSFKCQCRSFPSQYQAYQVRAFTLDSNICGAANFLKRGDIIQVQRGSASVSFEQSKLEVPAFEFIGEDHRYPVEGNNDDDVSLSNYQPSVSVDNRYEQEFENLRHFINQEFHRTINLDHHDHYHHRHKKIVNLVNRHPRRTWTARMNRMFSNSTLSQIRERYFGHHTHDLLNQLKESYNSIKISDETEDQGFNGDNWDPREKFPYCRWEAYAQEVCGSCVPFAASTMLSLRYCMKTQGRINVRLSPQYILNCYSSSTCKGALVSKTLPWLESNGIPTMECVPYVSGRRAQSGGSCPSSCSNGESFTRYNAKRGSSTLLRTSTAIETLRQDGPIVGVLDVKEDLLSYADGVYQHTFGGNVERHAVTIIGYGEESGIPFYYVLNSWSADFGKNGYAKIARKEFIDLYRADPDV